MNTNAERFNKAWQNLTKAYKKEQLEYIERQINKIRNSVEDEKSQLAWHIVIDLTKIKAIRNPN